MLLVPGHASDSHLTVWVMSHAHLGAPRVVARDLVAGTETVGAPTMGGQLPQSVGSFGWQVMRFDGLPPDRAHLIRASATGVPARDLVLATLPSSLPADGLTFAIASCFSKEDDRGAGGALRMLGSADRPRFRILLGDQVYADTPWRIGAPTATTVEDSLRRTLEYWSHPSYAAWLGACPNHVTFDDHEFWNNFPEVAPHLARSYPANAADSAEAAAAALRIFQRPLNPTPPAAAAARSPAAWHAMRPCGVPIFVADVRTDRQRLDGGPTPSFLGSGPQAAALAGWVDALDAPGILVLGQPLLDRPAGWPRIVDASLANYPAAYAWLWRLIARSRWDILVLSGDIHCGRAASATFVADGRPRIVHEFIASPLALLGSAPGGRATARAAGPAALEVDLGPEDRIGPISYRVTGGTGKDNVGLVTVRRDAGGFAVRFRLLDVVTGHVAADETRAGAAPCDWVVRLGRTA